MRKFVLLVGVILFMSLSASAQDNSKVDIFGGYSYLRFSPGNGAPGINFNGGIGSISYNPSSWIGVVGEFGGYHSSHISGAPNVGVTSISYLFGPKIFMSTGKIEPFGQVLFGGLHASCSNCSSTPSENAFGMALGGGLDYKVMPHIAIRVGQVEYLMSRFSVNGNYGNAPHQNNFRYSAGVVFKF